MHPGDDLEFDIDRLAAGGEGVGRAADGRAVFVGRTAPGDRVRATVVEARGRWARATLREVVRASGDRVAPPCPLAASGACGGCAWQHVALPAQHAAKAEIVAHALRAAIADGLALEPLRAPAPPLGWRRRVRLHVAGGVVGLHAAGSNQLADVATCVQLEPGLDAALAAVRAAAPPDGELALLRGHAGAVAVATDAAWPGAAALLGRAGIASIRAGAAVHGAATIEVDPGLAATAADFAQASAAGNAALVEVVGAWLGPGPGRLLELYAGAGNLTRAAVARGWDVTAADVAPPPGRHPAGRFITASAEVALRRLRGQRFDAVLLDPPRAGAAEITSALADVGAARLVYVSCDPATLGRDLARLAPAWRPVRAVPLDLMPQTDHVEVVVELAARENPARSL